jgi:hypothetical protein
MQLTKKKTAIMALTLIFCIGIVSAAVLPYFGIIKTNVTVDQGIKVDGHSWDSSIETFAYMAGHGIYYGIHSITNYGDLPTTINFASEVLNATTGDPITDELSVNYFINSATLMLENKNPNDWTIYGTDGIQAFLTYNLVGYTFDYKLLGFKLEPNTAYSLIYYADFDEFGRRFDPLYWGGNNPGAFIGSATTDGNGNLLMSGNANLGIDLPSIPDANIDYYNYSFAKDAGGTGDMYLHNHGAKIWLVPSDCYSESEKRVTIWAPDKFLFETDLISYINLGVTEHYIHPDPEFVTEITVPAHSTVSFVIRIKSESATYGTYLVTTTVSPAE